MTKPDRLDVVLHIPFYDLLGCRGGIDGFNELVDDLLEREALLPEGGMIGDIVYSVIDIARGGTNALSVRVQAELEYDAYEL